MKQRRRCHGFDRHTDDEPGARHHHRRRGRCALPTRSAALLLVTTPAAAASTLRRWPTTSGRRCRRSSPQAVRPATSYADLLTERVSRFAVSKIAGSTRESFTINEISTGLQYRFVLPGPCLTFVEQQQCLAELRDAATSARFVVASGSLPPGAPANFYQQVALVCRDLGVPAGSGHIRRRPATHHLWRVPAQGERARTT